MQENRATLSNNEFHQTLKQRLNSIGRPLKLILHVGTPKTGTTSVQDYLEKKQRKLRNKGILFPNRFYNPNAPKHQWLERNLVTTHTRHLLENFNDILNHIEDHTHTILLSAEGIYNHWWDFPVASREILKSLGELFEMSVWVWFRDPLEFTESFYKQCIRNPRVETIKCYGKDMSFAETLEDKWFSQHLDYKHFIDDCDRLFGKEVLTIFKYQGDTVQTVSKLLGLATPHDNPVARKNSSVNTITTEIIRVLNRYNFNAKDKEMLIPTLQELSATINTFSNINQESVIDTASKEKVLKLSKESMKTIEKRVTSVKK